MKPINTNLTLYTDRQIKTDVKTYEQNRRTAFGDQMFSVGDQVSFYKKDFARCKIIGTIQSIADNTLHVKTDFAVQGIKEFYLNTSEVKKYDPTSNRK